MNLLSIFLIATLNWTNLALPQEDINLTKDDKKKLKQAEELYMQDNFLRALRYFRDLSDKYPDDTYFKYKTGVCYLYKTDEREKAAEYLEYVEEAEPEFMEVKVHLGRAYHLLNRLDEALKIFEEYLKEAKPTEDEKAAVEHYIEQCLNAQELMQRELGLKIDNMGYPLSTEWSEYVPLISPDESVMIFTYRGKGSKGGLMDETGKPDPQGEYFEDILISYKKDGEWTPTRSIAENINTEGHDAAIALSFDGQKLLIFKSDKKKKEDIFISHLEGEDWSRPKQLKGEVNTKYWEGSATLASDGLTMYFASDRPGGFGGRDLYSAKLQPDNTWREVQNLGPTINTPYNEDAPFIHPNNQTLYFASEGHFGIGGYDIFYSELENDGNWTEPENLGYPVNTTDDDRYYVVSADGSRGYLSSARTGGAGQHDVYIVTPGAFGEAPVLALVIGEVKLDNRPIEATLRLSDAETNEPKGIFTSNAVTGKYTLAVVPGNKYKLAIEIEDEEPYIEYINVESLTTYVDVRHEFKIFSGEYKRLIGVDETVIATLQDKMDEEVAKRKMEAMTGEKVLTTDTERAYAEVLRVYGDKVNPGVEYLVDLPAAIPVGISKEDIKTLNLSATVSEKGDTTYVLPNYKTLEEAEKAKQLLTEKYPELAGVRIAVNDKGERKEIEEYFVNVYEAGYFERAKLHDDKPFIAQNKETETESNNKLDMGDVEIEGVTFKVEIGAFENPDDFNLQHFSKYGEIKSKTYLDGITRYAIDPFKTLKEAEEFRKMLVENEPEAKDAFVTVFVLDKRKSVEEFLAEYAEKGEQIAAVVDTVQTEVAIVEVEKKKEVVEPVIEKKAPGLGDVIVFKNILFNFDRSFLRSLSEKELDKIISYMKNNKELKIVIDGHADWIGTDEYNDALSERRAVSALSYIQSKGIGKNRIEFRYFGESKPVAANASQDGTDNPDGRQLNRRCEFRISSSSQPVSIVMKF